MAQGLDHRVLLHFLLITFPWEKAMATPVLSPGKSHGRRSLVGYSPWGHKESDPTSFSLFTFMHWRRQWQPTPVFLPGESQGRRNLVGCRLWGRTESDTTEVTQQQQQHLSLFTLWSTASASDWPKTTESQGVRDSIDVDNTASLWSTRVGMETMLKVNGPYPGNR